MRCGRAVPPGIHILIAAVLVGQHIKASGLSIADTALPSRIERAHSFVSPDELIQHVSFLAADSLKGRLTGTPENKLAAEYIANEFSNAGLQPFKPQEGYLIPFRPSDYSDGGSLPKKLIAWNVAGFLPGKTKPEEVIIFSAHYDHVGYKSKLPHRPLFGRSEEKGDTIYNGANDNASGTSALIALAKYFATLGNNERSILFVAFSAEELGLIGSTAFQRAITPKNVKAVINIEMIGRGYNGRVRPYITGGSFSDLRNIMNKQLALKGGAKYGNEYFSEDDHGDDLMFYRSDNFPFANQGIPAHTVMLGTDLDPHYHSVQDEAGTIDYKNMSEIITAIALAAEPLIGGTATPKRINRRRLDPPPGLRPVRSFY